MSVFSRFRDIINSELNSLIEKAENPIKMMALIIQEMNDTLIDLKISYRDNIAKIKGLKRQIEECEASILTWQNRALNALQANKEELAKAALKEKLKLVKIKEKLEEEISLFDKINLEVEEKISELIAKINKAKVKYEDLKDKKDANHPMEDDFIDLEIQKDIDAEMEKLKQQVKEGKK